MSYNLADAKNKLALDVALTSRIEAYGMPYDVDWWEMFNRQMIINALEFDDIYNLGCDNLVKNGDFAVWVTDDPKYWTLTGVAEDPNRYITENPTGKCQIVSDGPLIGIYQDLNVSLTGTIVSVEINIVTIVTGSIYFRLGYAGAMNIIDSEGVFKQSFFWDGSSSIFYIQRNGACNITIDDVSITPNFILSAVEREKLEDKLTMLSNK